MLKAQVAVQVALLVAVLAYLGAKVVGCVMEQPTHDASGLRWNAFTNADHATIHLTNPTAKPIRWCGQSYVFDGNVPNGPKAESNFVCATVTSYSTTTVEAHYPIGSAKKVCPAKNDLLSSVDWDRCTFTISNLR